MQTGSALGFDSNSRINLYIVLNEHIHVLRTYENPFSSPINVLINNTMIKTPTNLEENNQVFQVVLGPI